MQQDSFPCSRIFRGEEIFRRKESPRAGISSTVKLLEGAVLGKINGRIFRVIFLFNTEGKALFDDRVDGGENILQRECRRNRPLPAKKSGMKLTIDESVTTNDD